MRRKMDYSTKLKDLRWKEKRSEIISKRNPICSICREIGVWFEKDPDIEKEVLHVHHLFYLPNLDPWDYPDVLLIVVCEPCHRKIHSLAMNNSKFELLRSYYSLLIASSRKKDPSLYYVDELQDADTFLKNHQQFTV